jgi:hypothetical protein
MAHTRTSSRLRHTLPAADTMRAEGVDGMFDCSREAHGRFIAPLSSWLTRQNRDGRVVFDAAPEQREASDAAEG